MEEQGLHVLFGLGQEQAGEHGQVGAGLDMLGASSSSLGQVTVHRPPPADDDVADGAPIATDGHTVDGDHGAEGGRSPSGSMPGPGCSCEVGEPPDFLVIFCGGSATRLSPGSLRALMRDWLAAHPG
jgi:hypothetical protein